MLKKILQIASLLLNILAFVVLSAAFVWFLWIYFGKNYIENLPVGGDYFNALTYQIHFLKYMPHPASGWLPFWHAGSPVIGGYQFLNFYLVNYLTKFFEIVTAFNFFSAASVILFAIATLALFWQISKNWLLAVAFTAIVATTKATYYQLTVGGFITAATSQWYLPVVLFFIWRFGQTQKIPYLILASIFSGLSLIYHAPANLLMIFAPSVLVLFFQPNLKKVSEKVRLVAIFTAISFAIGAVGLFTVFLQQFQGTGANPCASPECWGDYPRHFQLWLTPFSPLIAGYFLVLTVVSKIFKRDLDLKTVLPAITGFAFFILYATAANLKLINELANIFFPTRFFWTANLFILIIAASSFAAIKKVLPIHSYFLAAITGLVIIFTVLVKPTFPHVDRPNTVPPDVASYILPKYQTNQISDLVPEWILTGDKNWRVDIFQPGIYQWFNIVSELPAVRGSSNAPLGVHADWLYFLQVATRNIDQNLSPELVKNRVLFLLDSFGVGFFENSMAPYPDTITGDSELIINSSQRRNSHWYQLSSKFTTPIVSPTNTPPILFVGSDTGYNNFIRSIAMTNLNSQNLIPVKGPKKLGAVSKNDLERFSTLVLYDYSASVSDFEKLEDFVRKGDRVFVETGSGVSGLLNKKLPEIFPVEVLKQTVNQESNLKLSSNQSKLLEGINLQNFSPLIYKEGGWKINVPKDVSLRNWAKPVINYKNQPVVTEGDLGNGKVIWSGLNLPFHIVENNNFEEAKFFRNMILNLIQTSNPTSNPNTQVEFKVSREKPEKIEVQGKNFTGIYFKENYHSGWKAQLDGKILPIYKAGLDFMYIPILNNQADLKVNLNFTGNFTTWGLFWLTTTSLFLSLLYLIIPQLFQFIFKKLSLIFHLKIKGKFIRWVEEES